MERPAITGNTTQHQISRRRFLRLLGGAMGGAAAVSLLVACGGGRTAGGNDAIVQMDKFNRFSPEHVTIIRGHSVIWENTSDMTHTATADPAKAKNPADVRLPDGVKPWDSGDVPKAGQFSFTFTEPGEYTYFCVYHEAEGMVGRITVTE